MRRRCRARLEPGVAHAGPYHGRCDLDAGHDGPHELERGMDTVLFRTVVACLPLPFEEGVGVRRFLTLSEPAAATARMLTVHDRGVVAVQDLLLGVRTGEVVRVTAVAEDASGALLTVERGLGTRALPLVAGDELVVVGR